MKIAVIGGGSMGLAFVRCWLDKQIEASENIVVIEASEERRIALKKEISVNVESELRFVNDSQLVFIAVKPQDFQQVAKNLLPHVTASQLMVSIMAGVTVDNISKALNGHQKIVRVMPNLPIVVGQGLSAYYATKEVEPLGLNILEQMLKAGGDALKLENEDLLNAVTAVSGSGPGYIFYLLEHLEKACSEFGFSSEQAQCLISKTMAGALELWKKEGRSAAELRKLVTSKGGTTAAALTYFEQQKVGESVAEGLKKAKARAEELAN